LVVFFLAIITKTRGFLQYDIALFAFENTITVRLGLIMQKYIDTARLCRSSALNGGQRNDIPLDSNVEHL
jgi:hypothetical protein